MTAIYGPIREIRKGVDAILEIDKQLTNLRKVADGTIEDFQRFGKESAELGRELGRTAQEVVQVSVEFARLGYDMKQSMVLAEEALTLANVGVMAIEDATRSLIATTQGFGIEVDDHGKNVRRLVDMINQVGKFLHLPHMLATTYAYYEYA